jgi:guanine deaminase
MSETTTTPGRTTPRRATSGIRGHVITFSGDPFLEGSEHVLVDVPDALVLTAAGVITAFGPYATVKDRIPPGLDVAHFPEALITAGFIDTHCHYLQSGIIAAFGEQLIDWLNTYTSSRGSGSPIPTTRPRSPPRSSTSC